MAENPSSTGGVVMVEPSLSSGSPMKQDPQLALPVGRLVAGDGGVVVVGAASAAPLTARMADGRDDVRPTQQQSLRIASVVTPTAAAAQQRITTTNASQSSTTGPGITHGRRATHSIHAKHHRLPESSWRFFNTETFELTATAAVAAATTATATSSLSRQQKRGGGGGLRSPAAPATTATPAAARPAGRDGAKTAETASAVSDPQQQQQTGGGDAQQQQQAVPPVALRPETPTAELEFRAMLKRAEIAGTGGGGVVAAKALGAGGSLAPRPPPQSSRAVAGGAQPTSSAAGGRETITITDEMRLSSSTTGNQQQLPGGRGAGSVQLAGRAEALVQYGQMDLYKTHSSLAIPAGPATATSSSATAASAAVVCSDTAQPFGGVQQNLPQKHAQHGGAAVQHRHHKTDGSSGYTKSRHNPELQFMRPEALLSPRTANSALQYQSVSSIIGGVPIPLKPIDQAKYDHERLKSFANSGAEYTTGAGEQQSRGTPPMLIQMPSKQTQQDQSPLRDSIVLYPQKQVDDQEAMDSSFLSAKSDDSHEERQSTAAGETAASRKFSTASDSSGGSPSGGGAGGFPEAGRLVRRPSLFGTADAVMDNQCDKLERRADACVQSFLAAVPLAPHESLPAEESLKMRVQLRKLNQSIHPLADVSLASAVPDMIANTLTQTSKGVPVPLEHEGRQTHWASGEAASSAAGGVGSTSTLSVKRTKASIHRGSLSVPPAGGENAAAATASAVLSATVGGGASLHHRPLDYVAVKVNPRLTRPQSFAERVELVEYLREQQKKAEQHFQFPPSYLRQPKPLLSLTEVAEFIHRVSSPSDDMSESNREEPKSPKRTGDDDSAKLFQQHRLSSTSGASTAAKLSVVVVAPDGVNPAGSAAALPRKVSRKPSSSIHLGVAAA